uniref:Candidate secreted effector n=1 Tax=Meloidogyne incognita TaxID=6306 RepID=A0A914M4X8_MELIC
MISFNSIDLSDICQIHLLFSLITRYPSNALNLFKSSNMLLNCDWMSTHQNECPCLIN